MATIATNLPASTAEIQNTRSIVTTKHKRWQVIKISVIAVLTVLSICFIITDVVSTAKDLKRQQELKEYIQNSLKVVSVIISLQDERSTSTSHCMALLFRNVIGQNQLKLQNVTAVTDMRIEELRHKWKFTFAGKNGTVIRDFASFMKGIDRLRSQLRNETEQGQIQQFFKVYTSWIHVFISWLVNNSQSLDDANELAAYEMIVKSREEFEVEKAFGVYYYYVGYSSSQNNSQRRAVHGETFLPFQNISQRRICGEAYLNFTNISQERVHNLTFLSFQNISQKRVRGEAFLETARLLSPVVNDNYLSLEREVNTSIWLAKLKTTRQNFSPNPPTKPTVKDAFGWFDLMTQYCDLLVHLEANERKRISCNIEKSVNKNTTLLILRSLLVCAVLIILPFFIISLVRVQNEIYKYAHSLHQKVDLEQSRTEFLLAENSRHMEGEYYSLSRGYMFSICDI